MEELSYLNAPELRDPGEGFPPLERHTVDQPSKAPTPKVVAATGVPLVLWQVFDVLQDLGVNIIQSARELLATIFGDIVAWFVREYRERRKD